MKIAVHNKDRLDPLGLLHTTGTVHYFADTRFSIRTFAENGAQRVVVMPLPQDFLSEQLMPCFGLYFDAVEPTNLPEEFDRVFSHSPRVAELYEALVRAQWSLQPNGIYNDVRTGDIVIRRFARTSNKIWSPFLRRPEIVDPPREWDRQMLTRALANGQYVNLRSMAHVIQDGTVHSSPLVGLDANELSRILMEDDFYAWTISRRGENVIAESRREDTGDVFVYEIEPGYIEKL